MIKRKPPAPWGLLFLFSAPFHASPVQRFPRPEFETDYIMPGITTPEARSLLFQYLDLLLLVLFLAGVTYIVLRKKNRTLLFICMLLALAYFGFYRKGCICPVGSIQNVVTAFFHTWYLLPLTVILFFFLPLITTLLSGRTFCAGVCPLGAFQDALLIKPLALPRQITLVLEQIPPLYLGAAVLLAATGSGFLICTFDPFVAFFRFAGNLPYIIYSLVFGGICLVLARPYCRFLCPYGVLLNLLSRLSLTHTRITSGTCINCGLCVSACPVGAVQTPTDASFPGDRKKAVRTAAALLLLLPLVLGAGALAGWNLGNLLSMLNPSVQLANQINLEERLKPLDDLLPGPRPVLPELEEENVEIAAFKSSTKTYDQLLEEVFLVRRRFRVGSLLLGVYLVLVLWTRLFSLSLYRRREFHSIEKGACISCLRCSRACPL